jgi:MarR family
MQNNARMRERVARLGLTTARASALRELTGPMTMRELAERRSCEPSNATVVVDHLESQQLLDRCGFPGHLGAGAHRDVRLLHGRRVVDIVPEHRRDLALLPQDVDQAHFVLGVTWAITPRSSIPASASSSVMPPNSAPVITMSIACAPLAGSR